MEVNSEDWWEGRVPPCHLSLHPLSCPNLSDSFGGLSAQEMQLMHSKKVDFVLLDEKKRMNILSLGDSSERKKEEEELPTRTDDEV